MIPRSMWVVLLVAVAVLSGGAAGHAADWQAGAGPEWAKTLEAARGEGKVVVMGRSPMARPMQEAFKRDTGIDLDFLGGEGREQQSRILREIRANRVTIDVFFSGQSMVSFVKDGLFNPIKPQLMLPGVTDSANWVDGHIKWVDAAGQYMLIGGEYIHCWPVINTDVVKPETVRTWKDLLKPEFKGKIAAFDPTNGPGQAQAGFVIDLYGIEFFKQLYVGQQTQIFRDSRQLMEAAARGVRPIVLGGLQVELERFRKAGVTALEVLEMQDGHGARLGGSSVLVQPVNPPHPNAATVFINWYASQPGQLVFSTVWKTPSRRVDVDVPGIPDFVKPKPGVKYVDHYTEDWYMNRYSAQYRNAIIEAMGGK